MDDDTADLGRMWKEFGKHTEAGKLLYEIYGVRYRPQDHINYPKLIMKTPEMKERERLTKERLKEEAANNYKKASVRIDYTSGLRKYQPNTYNPYGRVDYIPHRKNEQAIKQELNQMKEQMIQKTKAGSRIYPNRKQQIESLQDKFEFQERKVMPKGARMPGIKLSEKEDQKGKEVIHENIQNKIRDKNDKRGELENLYNKIVQEIDDRYAYMGEMKKLGRDVDQVIMAEIKDRITEMKTLQALINDYDKKNNSN